MQMQSNKLFCTELCTCGIEDESCNNLMLDDQSIDEDSLTDGMLQTLFYYISQVYINIDSTLNIMLSQL